MFLSFCVLDDFFRFFNKFGIFGILGQPYCGVGATIRIGREMLCLPYEGFLNMHFGKPMKIATLSIYFRSVASDHLEMS